MSQGPTEAGSWYINCEKFDNNNGGGSLFSIKCWKEKKSADRHI